ncbi:hypothetical protein V8E54_006554 [Elaphomyces granulatus]
MWGTRGFQKSGPDHVTSNHMVCYPVLTGVLRLSQIETKVDANPSKVSSENDPLDFSSIKNDIKGNLPSLQSNILDHLVSLLQCTNEDNQIQNIRSAVGGITELYLRAQPADSCGRPYPKDPEGYGAETFLGLLWSFLFRIVRMIPYRQELLINFLKTLGRKKVGTVTWKVRIWGDLPILNPSLRDEWCPPTLDGRIPSSEESSEWLSLNSFAARLMKEGLVSPTPRAVSRLRTALEQENTVREVANCDISG